MNILMPALSPTMEQGSLVKWLVALGDAVTPGDVVAEIETDKATMEVEAADAGVIAEILVEAGAEGVAVNTPIARLAPSGGAGVVKVSADLKVERPADVAFPAGPDAGAAEPLPPTLTDRPPASGERSPVPEPDLQRSVIASSTPEVRASPLARRIAGQRGLDLAAINGSGPYGRIIRRDVEAPRADVRAPLASPIYEPEAMSAEQALTRLGIAAGSYDLQPLDGMRRTIARRMTESFRDVPHFPLTIDLEIDTLLQTRSLLNSRYAPRGVRISVNDMIIKAAATALVREPRANASYTPEGIALHRHADIAMAVAVDGGLLTPIIRKAETKGLAAISTEAKALAARARSRELRPEEFQGGTFSISNLGMFGVRTFTSILNAPQGAILSVGAGAQRPVVRDGELAVATVMTVTLTCDHRVVDGAVGAAWLSAFRTLIENPMAMML